jgi:hypothetical protein
MSKKRIIVSGAAVILGSVIISAAAARQAGQPTDDQAPISGAESREKFSPEQLMGGLGKQLVSGLEATPGCLGAEAASFASGKLAIFGWFEDKQAALRWQIGVRGFEPPTFSSRTRRATKLRYTPRASSCCRGRRRRRT